MIVDIKNEIVNAIKLYFPVNFILEAFLALKVELTNLYFFLIKLSVHKIAKTNISKVIATYIACTKSPYPNQLLNIPTLKVSIQKYKTVP